ncbi:hypothetical protein LTR85_011544 [Meristemomyces frigidus]|nr:hypothetical protein LTR85_011544 [Meristemomyces frigidus]
MDPQTALIELQAPESLTILSLSHHILDPDSLSERNRTSNASDSSAQTTPTPALLSADLAHYRDLFSKLRFSYVEQVTKERFLRAITSDPPEFVDGVENGQLEEKLRIDKATLKERKEEVRTLVQELEEQGRQLAHRYDAIQVQTVQLETLPAEIENLQSTISALQDAQEPKSSNPSLAMPLQPTLKLLAEREQQLSDIDRQIVALQAALPAKRQEVERLQDELAPLQMRKINAVQEAKQARRRREDGGLGDELEEKGRWLRSVDSGLRAMLEV